MNPESPEPGCSGRKRKGPDGGGSSSWPAAGEESDGSWEDADSSDEHVLQIDEPKKKKVRYQYCITMLTFKIIAI